MKKQYYEMEQGIDDLFLLKQKTAYEMHISDWSSDVCSSDLPGAPNRASTWAMLMPRLGMAALFSCCTRSTSRTSADAAPARHSRAAADNEIRMRGMTDSPKGSKDECRCVLADYDPGG